MKNRSALAVMLKSPAPGRVKTRLTPPLTPEQASSLYRCFIEDTMRTVLGIPGVDVFAAYSPESDPGYTARLAAGSEVFAQSGADLGERIFSVFSRLFAGGYSNVVVIGTDSPDLPPSFIEDAFARLAGGEADMVLGPADDGGYYLVGLGTLARAPFEGVAWSTETVLDETLEKARGAGLAVSLLGPWHDIDRPEDLEYLRCAGTGGKGGDTDGAPSSTAVLAGLAGTGRSSD
jgi:hypothetical protein